MTCKCHDLNRGGALALILALTVTVDRPASAASFTASRRLSSSVNRRRLRPSWRLRTRFSSVRYTLRKLQGGRLSL